MDLYPKSNAFVLYGLAIGLCCAAVAAPTNPVLRKISAYAGAIIGTMLSSPDDMRAAAEKTRGMIETVDNAATSVHTTLKNIDHEDWEKMSRPDVEAAAKKFTAEAKDSSQVYKGLADALDQLAGNSQGMAVASLSVAGILAALSLASTLTNSVPALGWAAQLAATASGNVALATLRKFATQGATVYAVAAAIAMAAGAYMAQRASANMGKAVTPTGKAMPEFEQVYIPDLPKFDKKNNPIGMKKDS